MNGEIIREGCAIGYGGSKSAYKGIQEGLKI